MNLTIRLRKASPTRIFLSKSQIFSNQPTNAMRGGMLSARHPPRERIDSLISNYLPREGVAALPYTESLTSAEHVSSIATALSRAGGHGGPPLR